MKGPQEASVASLWGPKQDMERKVSIPQEMARVMRIQPWKPSAQGDHSSFQPQLKAQILQGALSLHQVVSKHCFWSGRMPGKETGWSKAVEQEVILPRCCVSFTFQERFWAEGSWVMVSRSSWSAAGPWDQRHVQTQRHSQSPAPSLQAGPTKTQLWLKRKRHVTVQLCHLKWN